MTARRARPYQLTAPVVSEHAIQKQVTDVLRIELAAAGKVSGPGVVWWSVSHENYAGEVPGIRVSRGIIAGLPDMFFLFNGWAAFIELKTEIGILSDAQRSICAAVLAAGGRVGVARSAEEVLSLLDAWDIPRAHRINPPF